LKINKDMKNLVQINTSYDIRTIRHQGKPHLVAPVVMMIEGVHFGNHGPIFHSAAELGKVPASWNGIPVVVRHPEENGQNVSANSPQVIDSEIVGRVYNTHMEDNKLKAEVWLDEERIRTLHPTALAYIRQGRSLEVSVGVFTDDDTTEGEWNNEHYQAIARNHRPDHLALLPGEKGACSWEDGCGIRNNKKGGNEVKDEVFAKGSTLLEAMKSLSQKGFVVSEIGDNEQGYRTLVQAIQTKLDTMDSDFSTYYLQEVFEDSFVYEVRKRDQGSALYKLTYQTNEDETVEFDGDPVEVRRDVKYVSMALKRTKFSSNNKPKKEVKIMSDDKKTPCCPERVQELINNKLTKFTDEDKKWLLTQEEDTIEKLFPNEPKVEEQSAPEINKEQVKQAVKELFSKQEEYIQLMPDEMQDSARSGLKLHSEQREKKIKGIMDNAKDVWKEEDLKAMNAETLDKVYASIKVEGDYSLNAHSEKPINTNTEEVLLPTGVKINKEEEK